MLKEIIAKLFVRFSALRNEEGATAAEYGLLVALIAVIMAVGAAALGVSIDALFDQIAAQL
jgi:pilus assembly protein Flp/PilA